MRLPILPIEVACPECSMQPGSACDSNPPHPPVLQESGLHFARIEGAQCATIVEAHLMSEPGYEPSREAFDRAVLATGVI